MESIEIREDPPESRKPLSEISVRPTEKSFWRSWLWAVLTAVAIVSTTVTVLAFTGSRARSEEARRQLKIMADAAVASHTRLGKFCSSAHHSSVPSNDLGAANCNSGGDMFYHAREDEYGKQGDDAGFGCLGYEITTPQHYQFQYESTGDTFTGRALGCIEERGSFEIHGHFDAKKERVVVGDVTQISKLLR